MQKWIAFLLVFVLVVLAGCASSGYKFGDVSRGVYKIAEENGWIERAKVELKDPENQKKIAKAIEKALKKMIEKD